MTDEKKPREFWIDKLSADEHGWMKTSAHKLTEPYDKETMSHLIHVIEKSAYDAVCAERDEQIKWRDDLIKSLELTEEHLIKERDQLRESLKLAVEALDHSKAAMKYAYEDHVDHYYLNVLEKIDQALNKLREKHSELKEE